MNKKLTTALAAAALTLTAGAQTVIGFESDTTYAAIGVYDSWAGSPFRTGELTGNVKVITNELNQADAVTGDVANPSGKILAFQRSRFAGNQFGARIDLKEPIALSPTTQYVHALIYKTGREGRVMLIGLGKRTDRPGQQETEQFKVLTRTSVKNDRWCDAVFGISGAEGINLHALVIVPDCESTHDLSEDAVVYIDSVEVSASANARVVYGTYPINFEKTDAIKRPNKDRFTIQISLNSPTDGAQTIAVAQQTNQLLFQDCLSKGFKVKAGETVTPGVNFFPGTWMHTYVYLDKAKDGQFQYGVADDLSNLAETDIVSFSYYNGKNSNNATAGAGNSVQPLAFTVPADLTPGFYRLRYKVDWDCIDPAGNSASNNLITNNGGVIVDTRLNVHGDSVTIYRAIGKDGVGGLNGDILNEDGSNLTTKKIPFGQPFTIKSEPAPGFKLDYVILRHGYGLEGDSLINDTPQYQDVILPAYLFQDSLFTITADLIDGDVSLLPYFASTAGQTPDEGEDYATNFDKASLTVTRTDRSLNNFTLTASGGKSKTFQVNTEDKKVYQDLTAHQMPVIKGETISTAVSYTGSAMHIYLYVDYSQDGRFDTSLNADGTPTVSSELVSYTYYNGMNSLGATISGRPGSVSLASSPDFTIPAFMPTGVYRARLKIDWNNIDPKGQWSEGGNNQIDANGGYVIDFLLNVHEASHKLDVQTTHGSINGKNNTGLPATIAPWTRLVVAPTPVAEGYEAEGLIVKHGLNLDGPQYIRGNRQWNETILALADTIALEADSINGDVVLTVNYEPTASANFVPVFVEEFNGADGSQPDEANWSRCSRQNPTWKRFMSTTQEEHLLTGYIEDGKFVARCLPNPFTATDNVAMISGGIESSGKVAFTYGKVEGRLKTTPHSGNFPAFWMMPQDNSLGWPYAGEIDIWEQIDAQNTTWHTIHTRWANSTADGALCQGQSNNPPKSGTGTATNGEYHTFGLEWTPTILKWFVDGKQVFSYAKSSNQSDLNLGQWPFDKPFYIILNQSVGNGGWAANADTSFTYETLFDWVRVYQDKNSTGLSNVKASTLDVTTAPGLIRIVSPEETAVSVVDMAGRVVFSGTIQGNKIISVGSGVYAVGGQKVLVP